MATELVSSPALLAVDEHGIVSDVGHHTGIDGVVGFALQIRPAGGWLATGPVHCPVVTGPTDDVHVETRSLDGVPFEGTLTERADLLGFIRRKCHHLDAPTAPSKINTRKRDTGAVDATLRDSLDEYRTPETYTDDRFGTFVLKGEGDETDADWLGEDVEPVLEAATAEHNRERRPQLRQIPDPGLSLFG